MLNPLPKFRFHKTIIIIGLVINPSIMIARWTHTATLCIINSPSKNPAVAISVTFDVVVIRSVISYFFLIKGYKTWRIKVHYMYVWTSFPQCYFFMIRERLTLIENSVIWILTIHIWKCLNYHVALSHTNHRNEPVQLKTMSLGTQVLGEDN